MKYICNILATFLGERKVLITFVVWQRTVLRILNSNSNAWSFLLFEIYSMENKLNPDVIQHGVSSCFKFSANCLYSIEDIITKLIYDMFNIH